MRQYQIKLAQILTHIDGAYSPNTLRAYRADFEEFISYCEETKQEALPAEPETIAAFITRTSENGFTAASIRRKLVSIAAIHRLSRNGDPTKDAEVRLAVRKMHRKLGRACGQAYAITSSLLEKLLKATSNDLRGKRDRALLMLAYDTMRRRAELVSLRMEDLRPLPESTFILLRRSKTDQEAVGTWLSVSKATLDVLNDWLRTANISEGFILRGITGKSKITPSLGGGQVGRIYKRLARQATLPSNIVERISGHSLRVGAAQDLLRNGATLPQIMVKGGWVKTETVMRYVEQAVIDSTPIATLTCVFPSR